MSYVVDILRGSESQRLIDNGHASLSVYGIGKGHSAEAWRAIGRALVHQGIVDETQDGYPVLLLNQLSREVLRGQRTVQIAATKPRKQRAAKVPASAATDGADTGVFASLRALRRQLADQAGVPPYVVFHDATLREMAQRLPTTLEQFATIPGVGQAKLARYAEPFLEALRRHAAAGG
jgi:ATP-dependent DNA helicase RecQ